MGSENVWLSKDANQLKTKTTPYYTLIETNSDDNVLLGACSLGGSYWNGNLWFFQKAEDAIELKKGIGMDVDAGASAVKFLPSGNQFIVADYSGHLSLIEIQQAAKDCPSYFVKVSEFSGHDDFVTSLDVDGTGTVMVSGSMDDSVATWDIESSTLKAKYAYPYSVKAVVFLPEKNTSFVTAGEDGRAFLWDTRVEKPASHLASDITAYTSVVWIDESRGVLSNISGSLAIFDIRKKSVMNYRICIDHGIRKLQANRSLNLLAAAVDDLTVRVYDCSDKFLTPLYESQSHSDFASGLAWLSESRTLLSSGWDSKILKHSVPTEADFDKLVPERYIPEEDW